MQNISCCFFIIFWTISCDNPCENAKQWLLDRHGGTKTNGTDTWNQLKHWISGNAENCLKTLLNDTKDQESIEKLNEILRKDVFKDEDEAINGTGKNCGPRRRNRWRKNRKGGRNKNQNKNRWNPGRNATSSGPRRPNLQNPNQMRPNQQRPNKPRS